MFIFKTQLIQTGTVACLKQCIKTSHCAGLRKFHSDFKLRRLTPRLLRGCLAFRCNLPLSRLESSSSKAHMTDDVRCMQVLNCCSELYCSWNEADVHKGMPLRGLDFDVLYYDSMPKAPSHIPVILALHGTSGSHMHFAPLLPYLKDSGARILMPNFPGCGFTPLDERKVFLHTDQERASFVIDFINALGISRVDVLIVHSASIYPSLYLLNDASLFKSIVLLNPAGHRPIKEMEPVWLYQLVLSICDSPIFRPLAELIIKPLYTNLVGGKKLNNEQLEIAARSLLYINFDVVAEKLKDIRLRRFPVIFSYALNDHVIGVNILDEMVKIISFGPEEILRYNADGLLVEAPKTPVSPGSSCIIFENGGHFVMNTHPEIIGKAITDLLKWLRKRPATANSR